MKNTDAVVIVIDDDAAMRAAIQILLDTVGLNSQAYDSGQVFLLSPLRPRSPRRPLRSPETPKNEQPIPIEVETKGRPRHP